MPEGVRVFVAGRPLFPRDSNTQLFEESEVNEGVVELVERHSTGRDGGYDTL